MANFPPRAGSGSQSSSQSSNQVGSQPGSGAAPPPSPPSSPVTGSVAGMRTAGVRPCPGCSTLVSVHATVCPNCGEQIAAKEKMVRCRRCRHRASSNLVLCPHCGRELQPAPSRWLTWGLPLLVLLMLFGFLVLRGGLNNPSSWAQAQVARVVRLVQSLGGRLQPDVTISMIPAGQDPNDPLVSQAAQAGAVLSANAPTATEEVDAATPAGVESAAESSDPTPEAAAAPSELAVEPTQTPLPTEVPPTATAIPAPTNTTTNTPAATSTSAATQTPVTATTAATTAIATPKATLTGAQALTRTNAAVTNTAITNTASSSTTLASVSTLTRTTAAAGTQQALTQTVALLALPTPTPLPVAPTAAPAPVATATPAPLAVYEVRRGDTLFEIAGQYDVSVEDLLAANGLTENDVYTIQPGDELKIPAPTPEGAPTAAGGAGETATATPAPETYTVRAGDTILAIALRNNVSVEDMLAANGMTINDARTLQPGDDLIIPGPEGIASATPTTTPTGAATGTPTGTPTSAPSPTTTPASVVRVDAPRLRSPENGTAVSCSGQETLTWLQVPSVRSTDLYLVHLGYVNSVAADGKEDVVWVISQQRPVSATSWQLDNNLCGLAPNTAGKQWRWYVEVAEPAADGLRPVSPASPVWGFTWQ